MVYKNPEDTKKYRDAHKEEMRVYLAKYNVEHAEQIAQTRREWRAKVGPQNITAKRREYHRVRYQNRKSVHLARQREYRRANPDKQYEIQIKRKFNLTLAQKEVVWLEQDKKCKICRRDVELRSSHIDHIHGSNPIIIRGLLCGSCNRGIGLFGDSPDRLRAAADYLSDISSFSEAPVRVPTAKVVKLHISEPRFP